MKNKLDTANLQVCTLHTDVSSEKNYNSCINSTPTTFLKLLSALKKNKSRMRCV